jgi:phage repressor protein C with HTH and peptisase S24 domain
METVGERIKQLRTTNRMTQEDFANVFSVSRVWITNIENGKRKPTELLIKSISNHFAVREEWLKTGELPIRDYSAEAVSSEIAEAYFELAAELAPSIDTPELLTNMLKNSSEYSEIFHYISFRFLNLNDKNEPKRLAALFSVAFPDYAAVAEELIAKVGEKQKNLIKSPPLTKKTPLHPVGKAAAGSALYDDMAEEKMVEIPTKYLDFDRYFSIEVKGDSMEPQLFDGDLVIVAKNVLPSPGQIALVHINNGDFDEGYLIKRYYPVQNNGVKLVSYNEKYEPIFLKCSQIEDIQLVVFSVHNYT